MDEHVSQKEDVVSLCRFQLIRRFLQEGLADRSVVEKRKTTAIPIKKIIRKTGEKGCSLRILPLPDNYGISSDEDEHNSQPPPTIPRPRGRPPLAVEEPSSSQELVHIDDETAAKIQTLRDKGIWDPEVLTACPDPTRQKTIWDFLLEEVKWKHTTFRQERYYRRVSARKLATAISRHHAVKAHEESKHIRMLNAEKEAKKGAGQVAKLIKEFWQKAETLVDFGQKEMEEAKKRADLDKHLSILVHEAGQLSKSVNMGDDAEEPEEDEKKSHDSKEDLMKIALQAESFKPKGNTLDTAEVQIKHPILLDGQLREYQLVGLNWLYALYDKNMNGILADEMGLGKTIQTIGLFAHLAAENAVWGPHLVVVPTTVMLNWEMEFKKWCPSLKVLTYFGTAKERADKRRGWMKKGRFDVCITSYKLFTQDVRCFKKKQWQYLVLDEAQHIKNFESQRWRSLINLRTRRRLLLTGTPLQNNLMELWSLLHFLMPSVFSSRDDFKDWFNKPISDMIEGQTDFNNAVVQKLHQVLRPFILRRLKSEVEKQLPQKVEKVISCDLSKRQRYLYNEFMSLRTTVESLQSGSMISVLNIVMQLRKCCNHPNLFEARQVQTPFCVDVQRQKFSRSVFCRDTLFLNNCSFDYLFFDRILQKSNPKDTVTNGIMKKMPPLKVDIVVEPKVNGTDSPISHVDSAQRPIRLKRKTNGVVWHGIEPEAKRLCRPSPSIILHSPSPNPTTKMATRRRHAVNGVRDVPHISVISGLPFTLPSNRREGKISNVEEYENIVRSLPNRKSAESRFLSPMKYRPRIIDPQRWTKLCNLLECPLDKSTVRGRIMMELQRQREMWATEALNRFGIYVAEALYPTMAEPFYGAVKSWHDAYLSQQSAEHLRNLQQSRNEAAEKAMTNSLMLFPEVRLIEYDCGKLQMLAILLRQLYADGHRCLIFTQMSKMLDILQAFLAHHGYVYFRLDGSTPVEKRQALMERFNSDSKVFCFILSTRAGGVGVNLIGADTVIFYDSDWNPTMDAQAQDRCHRIGQTKDVTIYRLISRSTIEENILKKAREKRRLGELAIDEAGFTPAFFKKTDNIRDLFYSEEDGPSSSLEAVAPIRTMDDKELMMAMENVEDRQDALAAKRAAAEVEAEEIEFSSDPRMSFADSTSEEFVQMLRSLRPIERFAVHLLSSELGEPLFQLYKNTDGAVTPSSDSNPGSVLR